MATYKAKLPNGIVLEGSKSGVLDLLAKLDISNYVTKLVTADPEKMHYSESKQEWIALEDMDSMYLKNVVLKELEKALKDLRKDVKLLDDFDFVERCDNLFQDAEKYVMELEGRDNHYE